jgi:protein transport protein SEC24
VIVVSETDEANVPLPPEKLFLNITSDRDKIDYMLEKLLKFSETIAA